MNGQMENPGRPDATETGPTNAAEGSGVAWLDDLIHHLEHLLPAQAPIRDFVHHNTLHGFQHLPFRAALQSASDTLGHRAYLPEREFRRLLAAGRIGQVDLQAAMLIAEAESASDYPFSTQPLPPGLDRPRFLLALFTAPTEALSRAALRWAIEECDAPARHDPLWTACVRAAERGDQCAEALAGSPEHLQKISPDAALAQAEPASALAGESEGNSASTAPTDALFLDIGPRRTWSDAVFALTGQDIRADLLPGLIKLFGAAVDRGVAAWPLPGAARGLYAAWRAGLRADPGQSPASDDLGRAALADELPDTAAAAIELLLDRYLIAEPDRAAYLTRLALSLPGWLGMLRWQEVHDNDHTGSYPGTTDGRSLSLLDGLAILLAAEYQAVSQIVFERWSLRPRIDMLAWYFREHPAEGLIRLRLHLRPPPEALASRAARLIASVPNPAEGDGPEWQALAAELLAADRDLASLEREATVAYPLWQVARQAGLSAAAIDADATGQLAAALHVFGPEARSYVWLLAYERAYREQVFAVLHANQARPRPAPARVVARAIAQALFCMDEREEGFRRHLEEVVPEIETFGAAGFFGVAMRWQGIDAAADVPLCPVVVSPPHRVREVATPDPDDKNGAALAKHRQRRARRLSFKRGIFQRSRTNIGRSLLGTLFGAPLALAALTGRLLAPRFTGRQLTQLGTQFDHPLSTGLAFTTPTADPAHGFTDQEQADRVAGILRTIGLLEPCTRFAPLVVIVGHGSHSLNNPHASAYDCGACGGKHGGPNARLLAAMANRPAVRQLLIERGIELPPDCWFIGAQHDTCDDGFQWFDLPLMPDSHRERFHILRRQFAEASRHHALQRFRRFASAPHRLRPEPAPRRAGGRGELPAQARPELGHVTNACAIIGRRALSRGTFLDRRSFLISYDPRVDADGAILEAILLAAGPVGAGISLEYYFSTVNNAGYGCRSKVMHNLAGLVGVMEGTQSDLRTGLPQQMIEIHEAMRLLVICDTEPEMLSAIVARQSALQELVGHGWITVAARSPSRGTLSVFEPARGWQEWQAAAADTVPRATQSTDCFLDDAGRFRREHLTPTLLAAGRAG